MTRAMVLGDRTGLDDEIEDAFRIAGTYHVLALSGAQVALIAGLFVGLMRLLRCGALATAVATSLAVGAYALLVGADPPVTRAAWMATAVLFGHAAGLGGEAANLLGLAGILLLGLQPSSAADASFQLSFAATLGILLWAVPLSSCLRRLPRVLTLPLAASLAAQLALAPLLVWHFHRLAPAALLLNLIAVPLSSAVLLGGAVTAVLDLVFTPLAAAAGWGTTWAAWGLLKSAVLAEWLPGTHVRLPDPSALAVACWLATIVCLTRRRLGWVAAWGVLMLAAFMAGSPPQGDGRLHLTALDVGDGDALVLRSPLGRTWLLDAPGGRPGGMNLGEAVVAPYLWHLGLTELDRVSYTHGHRDHAGGIPFLMQSFKVGSVIVGSAEGHGLGTTPGPGSHRRRLGVCRGWRDMWDGVEVNVLWPPCDPSATESLSENDRSMVVRLRYGQIVILLTGDAGREVEPDVPADVLKVGHHGRRTSSSPDFVRGVSPRVAVISVGRHGPQGPPHDVVLAELRRVGAVVLRTDASGAVTVSTDGERVWGRGERYPHGRVTLRRPRALPRE